MKLFHQILSLLNLQHRRIEGAIWFATMLCSLLCFTSCFVNEDIEGPCDDNDEIESILSATYFLKINVNNLTTDTRTETNVNGDTGFINNGVANERALTSATIYFFDSTNGNQVCTFQIESSSIDATSTPYSLTTEISIAELKQLIGKNLNVYVLGNISGYTLGSGTTEEDKFLNGTFTTTFGANNSYTREFFNGTEEGMICPMANYDKFTVNLASYVSGSQPTDAELVSAITSLFTGTYSSGKLWSISNPLELERMIARIDYKNGSSQSVGGQRVNNLYILPNHQSGIPNCNIGSGVYLKLNNITLFNADKDAYIFRHTSRGAASGTTATPQPFGVERDNATETDTYNWIADCDWGKTDAFFNKPSLSDDWFVTPDLSSSMATADAIISKTIENNDNYSPWFYVMENTVSSTEDMTLENCTGLALELVLWDATTKAPYVGPRNDDLRITKTADGYYQVLKFKETNPTTNEGYYYLTYRYLIPHNVPDESNVNNGTGSTGTPDETTGKINGLKPMQIGIVRNNIYQLSLKGINNLPDPHEPDNFYLLVDLKVLAWAKHDISVTW